jgi:hypothetical protein
MISLALGLAGSPAGSLAGAGAGGAVEVLGASMGEW